MARVTINLLGWTFDWSIEPTAAEAEAEDAGNDSGYTAASFVGFAPFEVPDEMPLPMRNNGWGDEGNRA
jgi:hypothetical protein